MSRWMGDVQGSVDGGQSRLEVTYGMAEREAIAGRQAYGRSV
jgi:hypothetical protein